MRLMNKDTFCLNPNYSTTRLLKNNNEKFTKLGLEHASYEKSGGLRIKGLAKCNYPHLPLVSIVTVVFNGEQYLEETLLSVIDQDYDNIEYIIIDGGSTDGTLEIISKYEDCIDLWISAKDNGVYDAMNKGIKFATGKYINFLNASDYFYNRQTVSKIFKQYNDADIIYGNIYVIDDRNNEPFYLKAREFTFANLLAYDCGVLNHQAMFIKKERAPFYNIRFKYRAELNWYYEIIVKLNNKGKIEHKDIPVVCYRTGGISYKKLWEPMYEWIFIEFKKGGILSLCKKIPRYMDAILNFYRIKSFISKSKNIIKNHWL